jgi:hypothetical protein
MKASDLFGVILRSIAVWLCIWGAWQIIAGIKFLIPTIGALLSGHSYRYNSFNYLTYGVPAFLSGLIILIFAESIVRLTYRQPKPPALPPPPDRVEVGPSDAS